MFWILHIVAIFVFAPALVITIPLHVLSNRNKKQAKEQLKELRAIRVALQDNGQGQTEPKYQGDANRGRVIIILIVFFAISMVLFRLTGNPSL